MQSFDFQIAEDVTRALIIRNCRHLWTARTVEGICAFWPSGKSLQPLCPFGDREEASFLLHDSGIKRAERRDVIDDPNTPTMSRKHQIIGAWLNHQVVNSHRWEGAALVLRPTLTAVVADIQSKLSSQEEKIRAD